MFRWGRNVGVEFKRFDAPRLTRSMHTVFVDLDLNELWVVYPGARSYPLAERITVMPLHDCIAAAPAGDQQTQHP